VLLISFDKYTPASLDNFLNDSYEYRMHTAWYQITVGLDVNGLV